MTYDVFMLWPKALKGFLVTSDTALLMSKKDTSI